MRQENVDCMRDGGSVVFLTATPQTIYERVKNSTDRPLLNGHMNVAYISELMEVRRPKYEAAADILVATDGKTCGLRVGQHFMGDLLHSGFYDRGIDHRVVLHGT